MSERRPRKKTNITLASDTSIIKELRRDAKSEAISINAKINAILEDYIRYGKMFIEQHAVITQPAIFKVLIQNVEEKVLIDAWMVGINEIVPEFLLRHGKSNFDLQVVEDIMKFGKRMGIYDNYYIKEIGAIVNLTINHSFGLKWSSAVAAGIVDMLEKVLKVHPKTDILSYCVLMRIPKV